MYLSSSSLDPNSPFSFASKNKIKPQISISCLALVPIVSPLSPKALEKQKWLQKLQEFSLHVEVSKEKIFHFYEKDLPIFREWFFFRFGFLCTKLRSLREEIHKKKTFFSKLADQIIFSQEKVTPQNISLESSASPFSNDLNEFFNEFLGQITESSSPRILPLFSEITPPCLTTHTELIQQDVLESMLRTWYRKLVMVLHPDRTEMNFPEKKEFWLELQKAKQKKDFFTIHCIALLVSAQNQISLQDDPLLELDSSLVLAHLERLKRFLSLLEKNLFQLQQCPAWNFIEKSRSRKNLSEIRKELTQKLKLQIRMDKKTLQNLKKQEVILFEKNFSKHSHFRKTDPRQMAFEF